MQSFVKFLRPVDTQMNIATPKLIRMKKWMRKSSIDFFNRNPDVIGASGFVPLCNDMIVKVMSTGFEVITRDTHFITCRSRQILSQNLTGDIYQESEIFKAESALNALFERTHEYFDTRITQGEQKLAMGGFGMNEIQKLVANYETKTVTNAVTQYVDILGKADHYITILQYLWVTCELSDNQDEALRVKLTIEREVRHILFAMTRASNIHYNNIRKLCNGVVEARSVLNRLNAIANWRMRGRRKPRRRRMNRPWRASSSAKRNVNAERLRKARI
jgi:hypothetical protein